MTHLIVTTSLKPDTALIAEAQAVAHELGAPYKRRTKSLASEVLDDPDAHLLIVEKYRLVLKSQMNELFWHPSTALVKVKQWHRGESLPLLTATTASKGDRLLDCTLGLASDALLLSAAVGAEGQVIGLEASPVIAFLTRHGLNHYTLPPPLDPATTRRIQVLNEDALAYLSRQPDDSFDIIYFDPMFTKPRQHSSAMNALREYACHIPLSHELVQEALRVSRRRVVVKERYGTRTFEKLGITTYVGNLRTGSVVYGILEK